MSSTTESSTNFSNKLSPYTKHPDCVKLTPLSCGWHLGLCGLFKTNRIYWGPDAPENTRPSRDDHETYKLINRS